MSEARMSGLSGPQNLEAQFFDLTDVTTMERAGLLYGKRPRLEATVAVRLDKGTLRRLRRMAKAVHFGPTQLVRLWIIQGLDRYENGDDLREAADELERLNRLCYPGQGEGAMPWPVRVDEMQKVALLYKAKVLVMEKALKDIATASDEVLASDLRDYAISVLNGWDE